MTSVDFYFHKKGNLNCFWKNFDFKMYVVLVSFYSKFKIREMVIQTKKDFPNHSSITIQFIIHVKAKI